MGSLDAIVKVASPTGVGTARRESWIQNNIRSRHRRFDVPYYLHIQDLRPPSQNLKSGVAHLKGIVGPLLN